MDGAFDRSAVERSALLESRGACAGNESLETGTGNESVGTGAVSESVGTGAVNESLETSAGNESLETRVKKVEEMEEGGGLPEPRDPCCSESRGGRKLGGRAKVPRVVAGEQS